MIKNVNCARLYADANGDTHITEIELPMEAIEYAPPAPALDLSEPLNAKHVRWMRFPSGWNDAAHPAPRKQLFVVLSGKLEANTSLGEIRKFRAGDCLIMEDTFGKGHGARPLEGEVLALVIALE